MTIAVHERNFVEPPWSAPLDGAAVLRGVAESATVAGLFLEPLAEAARKKGVRLASARERYTPFRFYPLREHVTLMLEACAALYPDLSLRTALRKFGRGAPKALLTSTLGKVVLASAISPEETIAGLVKAYPLNVRPCRVHMLEASPNRAIVRFEELSYFLDSHHVGVFEAAIGVAGKRGSVKISSHSPTAADFLCTWT